MSSILNSMRSAGNDYIPALHEDWRLIAIVGLFGACVLIRLTVNAAWPDTIWFGGAALASVILTIVWARYRLVIAIIFVCSSALYIAGLRSDAIPDEIIERQTFAEITGQVQTIEYRPQKPARLTLHVNQSNKIRSLIGTKIQIYVRTDISENIKAGDVVRLNIVFDRMNGPIVPGGFNYARYNLLKGIAAQGFATSSVELLSEIQNENSLASQLQNLRDHIAYEIQNKMQPAYAGIAISLITGQRQYLDDKTNDALRDTGLSHLLAISGLHMGLLTAAAFVLFELLFAAIPPLALRVLPRKLAGVTAWIFACVYLFISGGSTATVRAFIMVSIAIIAVLTDRRVVSLRSVALAAITILIIDPASILNISFHMSFAATTALVIAYEFWDTAKRENENRQKLTIESKTLRNVIFYVGATAATTLIAQIAVAPFALYHFQTLSLIGLLTNLIAIPLMAFIVMPSAFIALICIILGLDPISLIVMQEGLRLIMASVEVVQSIPGGVLYSQPYSALLLPIMGIVIITASILSQLRGILLWCISTVISIVTLTERPADILFDNAGRVVAQYIPEIKTMAIVGGRRNGFRDEAWQQYWGIKPAVIPQKLTELCDTRACIVSLIKNSDKASLPQVIRSSSLEETRLACSAGHIVIASYRHRRYCRGAYLFLSSEDIERYGPVGLWFNHHNSTNSTLLQSVSVNWSTPLPKR